MTKMGKIVSLAALAGLFVLALPVAASADELEAQCKIGNPIDGADKICKCVSDKITGSDRPGAIKAMKLTNDAATKGTMPDQSVWTDDMVKAMTTVATAEAGCMQ
jgi:hypothetical protein